MKFWRSLLNGAGQVLYCASPTTGAWLLLGIALLDPAAAVAAFLGLLAATGMARTLKWNQFLMAQGLFGYNAAMVGLAWPSLFPPPSPGFLLVVPAAIAATWLQGRMLPSFTRRDLPVLGLPFVIVIWAATLLFTRTGHAGLQWIAAPEIVGPQAGWSNLGLQEHVLVSGARSLPGVVAAGIGLWITSGATVGVALFGLLVGLGASLLLGGVAGGLWVGAYLFTAVPLALGVGDVFFPLNARSLAVGAGMSLIGVGAWVATVWLLAPLGLVPLTAVAHALLLGLLLATRNKVLCTTLGLRPRALSEAAPPVGMLSSTAAPCVPEPSIAELVTLLRRSSRIVVLSGAGMSTESGIPDYRTQLGFWYDASADDLIYSRFVESESSQRLYWRLHRRFGRVLELATPNAGHRALAHLEREGKLLGIVTQNVDGLHQAGGVSAERVVELHGNAHDVICLGCRRRVPYASLRDRLNGNAPPCDRCGGLLKADVVSFGEPLDPARLARATAWCGSADLLLIIGTSLQVAPARDLPEWARSRGVPVVVINQTPTPFDPWATLVVRGPAGELLSETARRLVAAPPPRATRRMTWTDFHYVCGVVDEWWGDQVRYLLHPLYVEHFGETCLVVQEDGVVLGFLIGFVSQGRPNEAYVHLVATHPGYRRRGIGRALYEDFFTLVRRRGCLKVSAITVPYNNTSIAFHRRMGFHLREQGAAWFGAIPFFPNYGGPGVDCVFMERTLEPFHGGAV